ncbi:MAG: hypothetical protein HY765_10420 [Rhodomicrobium sp.]|nr:hypothetical protein [Rhodomicrobium sp.]
MPLSTAETTYLNIRCPVCCQHTRKPVAWLVLKDKMTCMGCSSVIDLKSADNQGLIKDAAEYCARMDATLSKLD